MARQVWLDFVPTSLRLLHVVGCHSLLLHLLIVLKLLIDQILLLLLQMLRINDCLLILQKAVLLRCQVLKLNLVLRLNFLRRVWKHQSLQSIVLKLVSHLRRGRTRWHRILLG